MTKSDYFTDSIFQLEHVHLEVSIHALARVEKLTGYASTVEVNLHNIRQELTLMIEEFEKQDCLVCFQLKCLCSKPTEEASHTTSATSRDNSVNNSKDNTSNKAPPADSVAQPKLYYEALDTAPVKDKKGIEAWKETSKTAHNVRASGDRRVTTEVLAALRNYWSENNDMKKGGVLNDFKKDRALFDSRVAAANAVEVFFNSFKVQPVTNNMTPANIAFINKIAAGYLHRKSRSSEYSYF